MAFGGGNFISQNKVLPGAYINSISVARASATLGDRGVVACGLELDWDIDGELFKVGVSDFLSKSKEIFGFDYADEKMVYLRELYLNAQEVYFYRLNSGVCASNDYCVAKCSGVRGNEIYIKIVDGDDFIVTTIFAGVEVDEQVVSSASELVDNAYVVWKDFELSATAGVALTGGTNKSAVTDGDYAKMLQLLEGKKFNILVTDSVDEDVQSRLVAFAKVQRENIGNKFQVVVYDGDFDDEAVISVATAAVGDASALVYWVAGASAGCSINKSLTNRKYDGELEIANVATQSELIEALAGGEFVFHQVGDDFRVLEDVNTLQTLEFDKGEDFKSNQTVRVIDQISMDIMELFNDKYLGFIPNDEAGRISLWNDIVSHHKQLVNLRVIEDFEASDVEVLLGDTKKSVVVKDRILVVNAMSQLYMTIVLA